MYDTFQGGMRKVYREEDIKKVQAFLEGQGLCLEEDVEYTTALFHQEEVIATGSLSGSILKCIAVNCTYQGMGIMSKIVTELMNEGFRRGVTHLFIYTAPKNREIFTDLGFHEIASVGDKACLLENQSKGIEKFVMELKKHRKEGTKVGAIVMNGNPFTLGHQYLIENAAAKSDVLHLFIVWEERSSFPADIRYDLIEKGTRHLDNVVLHRGKDYVISNATFPSYFLKEARDGVKTHALLDLEIFKNYIVTALGINKRFIGEEPYCLVTRTYNETMKEILPSSGVAVEEIERLAREDEIISASKVRHLIAKEGVEGVKNLVPKSTYDFLLSKNAEPIIESLKKGDSRH